ncbi:MAG: preprotein translocase subunit YajC [Planctomycetota bacterium]|jgi:preprotein translocase subunit YajC
MFDTDLQPLTLTFAQGPPPPGGGSPPPPGGGQPAEPGTAAPGGPGGGAPGGAAMPNYLFPMLLLFLVMMILFTVFGQRRDKKKRAAMLGSVKKHDKVQTVGGVIGSIVEVKSDTIVVKVDESTNTRITFARSSIQHVLTEGPELDRVGGPGT